MQGEREREDVRKGTVVASAPEIALTGTGTGTAVDVDVEAGLGPARLSGLTLLLSVRVSTRAQLVEDVLGVLACPFIAT